MKITLKVPYVSTNRLYTINPNGSRRKTQAGRTVAAEMAKEAWAQRRGRMIEVPVFVLLEIFRPDRRRCDVDNTKGILDAMTHVLWADDSLIADLHSKKRVDRENPRVDLTTFTDYHKFIAAICALPAYES